MIGESNSISEPAAAPDGIASVENLFELLSNVSDCVQAIDLEGRIIRTNETGQARLGLQETTGSSDWLQLWSNGHRKAAEAAFAKARAGKAGHFVAATILDRGKAWWDTRLSPIRRGSGRVSWVLAVMRDISEQKQLEESLRDSETRCRALFENLPIPAWEQDFSRVQTRFSELRQAGITDLKEHVGQHPEELAHLATLVRVLDVTNSALELLGTTRERELHGFGPSFNGTLRSFFRSALAALFDGITQVEGEAETLTGTGRKLTVLVRLAVAAGCEERLNRVIVSCTDISQRKQFEYELKHNQERAELHAADLEAVMEAAPVGIFVAHDPNCRQVVGNAAAHELLGIPEGRNLAVAAQQPQDPDFQLLRDGRALPAEELPMVKAARTGAAVQELELQVTRRDGTTRSVLGYSAPLCEDGKTVRGAVCVLLDVTARKQAELRMDLLATTAEGLLRTNEPQQVINQLCAKALDALNCDTFFNFLVDEGSGKLRLNACGGVHPEQAREIEWLDVGVAVCGCAVQEGQRIVAERILDSDDPRVSHVKRLGIQAYACNPLRIRKRVLGTLSFGARSRSTFTEDELGLMKAVADMVAIALERRQAEAELRRANAELENRVTERTRSLEELAEQLNGFCHSVAHDLRGPLRTQIALSRLLLDDFGPGLGQEGAQYAKLISQAAERQMDLIQDLMAHITVSRADLPIGSVEIRSVVDAAISDLSIDIHKRHANVAWERVESRCVLANAPNLHLAIMNLLSNALKFVPSHLRPEVSIWTETKPGTVRLLLQDNGIGIESKDLSRLFGMFQRVNPQTGYPGTGLGLALVKKAVERMGGAVGVESSPGCGSRFWIDLKEAP